MTTIVQLVSLPSRNMEILECGAYSWIQFESTIQLSMMFVVSRPNFINRVSLLEP